MENECGEGGKENNNKKNNNKKKRSVSLTVFRLSVRALSVYSLVRFVYTFILAKSAVSCFVFVLFCIPTFYFLFCSV